MIVLLLISSVIISCLTFACSCSKVRYNAHWFMRICARLFLEWNELGVTLSGLVRASRMYHCHMSGQLLSKFQGQIKLNWILIT